MKKLLFLICTLFSINAFAQIEAAPPANGDDTTKYTIWGYSPYGIKMQRMFTYKVLRPPRDTSFTKGGLAIIDSTFYYGDETRWWPVRPGIDTFSSGDLSPLFTTSVSNPKTEPALSYSLSNTTAYTVFGRASGTGVPSFVSLDTTYISSFSGKVRSLFSAGSGLTYNEATGEFVSTSSGGSVTDVSVVTANGFQGTVATSTSTPAITLETSVTSNQIIYASSNDIVGSANLTYDGSLITALSAGLGVTQDDTKGLLLTNTTAAAAGAQQISPSLHWRGQGWKTNATAASQSVDFRSYVLPVQGAANPTGNWKLQQSINGGAYSDVIAFGSLGEIFTGAGSAGTSNQAILSGGPGAAWSWGTVDLSASNEIQVLSAGGTTSPTIDLSLAGGTITFNSGGIASLSRSGNTITITATEANNGTVTDFSAGDLSPLFTTSEATTTTTPALTFSLSNTTQYKVFGRLASGSGAPSYISLDTNFIANFSTMVRPLLSAGTGISYDNTTGVITNTGDLSATNELQSLSHTSDGDSHKVELSTAAGSIEFIEGAGVTLTSGGSGANQTLTITATGAEYEVINGLHVDAPDSLKLGGFLIENTAIDGNEGAYDMTFAAIDAFTVEAINVSLTAGAGGAVSLGGKIYYTTDISPSSIGSNQNNYSPTDFSSASVLRLTSDASRNITGLAGGADGRTLKIFNIGSNDIVLKDQDANSTAANRFELYGDKTIKGGDGIDLWYDATTERWRALDVTQRFSTADVGGNAELSLLGSGGTTFTIIPGSGISIATGGTADDGTVTISADLSGLVTDVTASGLLTSSGGTTPDISSSVAQARLVGRGGSSGTGAFEAIDVGGILSFSGTTLNATEIDGSTTNELQTVTGTSNRIDVSGGGGMTPTVDISSSYVGQSSITTLGTITTGVWNGTDVAFANIAQLPTVTLAGNSTGGTADIQAITLGSGLSFVGTVLTPADASATNEIQTFSSTEDGTTLVWTLASGGSLTLTAGDNIGFTIGGTSADPTVIISASLAFPMASVESKISELTTEINYLKQQNKKMQLVLARMYSDKDIITANHKQ